MTAFSGVDPIRTPRRESDDSVSRSLDLQMRRIMEAFFRMLDWPGVMAASCVEVRHEDLRTMLEARSGRIVMSLEAIHDVRDHDHALPILLRLAVPDSTGGLPIRVFSVGDAVYVSCTLPPNANAHVMLRVHRRLRRMLDVCRAPE